MKTHSTEAIAIAAFMFHGGSFARSATSGEQWLFPNQMK